MVTVEMMRMLSSVVDGEVGFKRLLLKDLGRAGLLMPAEGGSGVGRGLAR